MNGVQLRTIRQVARALHVRDSTVRAWIKSGDLPTINLGDSTKANYRISEDDLSAFIAGRRYLPDQEQKQRSRKNDKKLKTWF